MNEEKKETKDLTKGKKYKALTRVSFGHERPAVEAGQMFNLDDEELAKKLIASNSITADLKHEEPVNSAGGTNAGAPADQHLPPGQAPVKTAADLRDEAHDEQADDGKGKRASSAR